MPLRGAALLLGTSAMNVLVLKGSTWLCSIGCLQELTQLLIQLLSQLSPTPRA